MKIQFKKRLALLIFIVGAVGIVSNIFAAPTNPTTNTLFRSYFFPYDATRGLPMDSPYFQPVTKGWEDFGHGVSGHDGAYNGYRTIATGGITDILWNEKYNNAIINVKITITTPSGMNFVSLSNPHITRPYELYVVMKHTAEKSDGKFGEPNTKTIPGNKNFIIEKFDKSGLSITRSFTYRKMKDTDLSSGTVQTVNPKQKIWFDVVIGLPGQVKAGASSLADAYNYITIGPGNKKQLIVANDYSAAVAVDFELSCDAFPEFQYKGHIAIPMSGYYDGTKVPRIDTDSIIQFAVIPTSACNNLDLMNQQGQYIKIADIALKTTKQEGATKDTAKPAYIFVSSSPNPFATKADKFVLKHEQAPEFGEYNTRNHMRYNVMLYEKGNPDYIQYDGTMVLNDKKPASSYVPGGDAVLTGPANMNKLVATHPEVHTLYTKDDTVYQALTAELGLIMENKHGLAMIKGAYKSKIYVHVITNDDFVPVKNEVGNK